MRVVLARSWPLAAVVALLAVVGLASLGGSGARVGDRSLNRYARLGGPAACPDGSPSPVPRPASVNGTPQAAPTEVACVPPERRVVVGSSGDYKVIAVLFSGVGILGALVLVALGVALLVGLTSAAGSIRVRHRPRPQRLVVPDDAGGDARAGAADRLGAAVEAGLADLIDAGDPRRAVIAAWRRLELAAAEAGTHRAPAETPAELAARVLAAHAVSPATLGRLADLYREARYSRHEVDERMRTEARRALERLRGELTAAVPG